MKHGDKMVFGRLFLKQTLVHCDTLSFMLIEQSDGDLAIEAMRYDEQWAYIEPGCLGASRHGFNHSGEFLADPPLSSEITYTDTAAFSTATLSYHSGPSRGESNLDKLDRLFWDCSEADPSRPLHAPGRLRANLVFWATLAAWRQRHKNTPAFRINNAATRSSSRDMVQVGAWGFPLSRSSRWEKPTLKNVTTDEVYDGFREAYELKRWLHGYKSKHDTVKEVMKQAVRRRIIKNRVTDSDIQFFQTIFGVAQVGRWIKEAANKTKHDNTHAGRN